MRLLPYISLCGQAFHSSLDKPVGKATEENTINGEAQCIRTKFTIILFVRDSVFAKKSDTDDYDTSAKTIDDLARYLTSSSGQTIAVLGNRVRNLKFDDVKNQGKLFLLISFLH